MIKVITFLAISVTLKASNDFFPSSSCNVYEVLHIYLSSIWKSIPVSLLMLQATWSLSDEYVVQEKKNEAVHMEEPRRKESIPNRLHNGEATL